MKKIITIAITLVLVFSMVSAKVHSYENVDSQKMLKWNKSNSDFEFMDSKLSINSGRRSAVIEGTQLVCFQTISYSNLSTTQPKSYYEDLLITGNNTIENYYNKNSYGKFTCKTNGMFDDIKLSETWEKYYFENEYINPLFDDIKKGFKENNYDISPYDQNNDGLPDILFVLSPAITFGESESGYRYFTHQIFEIGGNILVLFFGTGKLGGGIIELPTIYFFMNLFVGIRPLYDLAGKQEFIGSWDAMAQGKEKGIVGLCSYSKYKAGWIDEPKTITKPGQYEVDALGGEGANKLFKIPIPGSEMEFLLIENRQRVGSDALYKGISSEGLVIYHLDESVPYDPYINSPSLKDRKYPGLQVLDRSSIGNTSIISWEALEKFVYKPGANFSEDVRRTSIDATTTVNTLPYGKTTVRETITIYDISKSGPKMTFKLRYDKPSVPIVNVDETMPFAKVEKGTTKTMKLNFRNIGSGNIKVFLKPSVPWITLDRTNFIGTDEDINVTVDVKTLKYGTNAGYILYSGTSEGQVRVTVDVTPVTGDINVDSSVDDLDVELLRQHLGENKSQITFDRTYDLDKNGEVNGGDLVTLAKNYRTKFWSFLLRTN